MHKWGEEGRGSLGERPIERQWRRERGRDGEADAAPRDKSLLPSFFDINHRNDNGDTRCVHNDGRAHTHTRLLRQVWCSAV